MSGTTYTEDENDWVFHYGRHAQNERRTSLSLSWELFADPITDDYLAEETDAHTLLGYWLTHLPDQTTEAIFGRGAVSISWYVEGDNIFEGAPFQTRIYRARGHEDFLTFFSWPRHALTGEPLNWNRLPVNDKRWRPGQATKGGFFQEVTGWKPAPLQPAAYIGGILAAADLDRDMYAPHEWGPVWERVHRDG